MKNDHTHWVFRGTNLKTLKIRPKFCIKNNILLNNSKWGPWRHYQPTIFWIHCCRPFQRHITLAWVTKFLLSSFLASVNRIEFLYPHVTSILDNCNIHWTKYHRPSIKWVNISFDLLHLASLHGANCQLFAGRPRYSGLCHGISVLSLSLSLSAPRSNFYAPVWLC